MADLADVETALVVLTSAALYPDGLDSASIVGVDCRCYRGWPAAAVLDADIRSGRINVTIFPDSTPGLTVPHYDVSWPIGPEAPALSCVVMGDAVTFDGQADAGQVVGLLVDDQPVIYRTVEGDTPAAVAANLATLIRADRICRLNGTQLVIPGVVRVLGRVVRDRQITTEVRRQKRDFRVSCWCPAPGLRDTVASAIDLALTDRPFIALNDGGSGRISYQNSVVYDQSQSASLYRRDLIYSVEYPTSRTSTYPAMLFGVMLRDTRVNIV